MPLSKINGKTITGKTIKRIALERIELEGKKRSYVNKKIWVSNG